MRNKRAYSFQIGYPRSHGRSALATKNHLFAAFRQFSFEFFGPGGLDERRNVLTGSFRQVLERPPR
jgi:hypothetical protein